MRKISIFLLILLSLCFMIQGETVERIVAKVGREVILQSELDKRYQQMIASGMSEENFTLESILDEMIESELILIKAKESDIEIDEYTIKKMAEQELESLKLQFENELEFRQQLKAETGLTITELKDYYEDLIREQKLRENVISKEITSQIHVTDAEIEEFYQENLADIPIRKETDRLGMILLKMEPSKETKEELKREIYDIKNKLNKGADFAELAKEYSDCSSAPSGGDLGWIERGLMVKPFEDAAFKLEVGEISDLVETQFGYHLILMQEKKDDQIKISHILKTLEASPEDKTRIRTLADDIHERIINGEDFTTLAREYSQDDSSAANGGIIGEYPPENYPELFSSYLQSLDYGEITDVIEEGDNLYIFGKLAKVEARPYTYEELYDQLKDQVFGKKQLELYNKMIENLKKTIYIEIYL
ncbi:MAG: peptidylprolyl isomerase [Candidatus Stygibacter australis]|nr:peptidylprolyl isomerase [Candidatus Stygibacter australis]MDP8321268.1 peptidylprolyl isomerase [Candidatus Stygibacter australis]